MTVRFWLVIFAQLLLWYLGAVECVDPCPPTWFAEWFQRAFDVWPWCCE